VGVRISAISFLNALHFGKTGGRGGRGEGISANMQRSIFSTYSQIFSTSFTVHQAIDLKTSIYCNMVSTLTMQSTCHGNKYCDHFKGDFFILLYSTQFKLPPLRFHCVGGC
jgi:hypothetical protein